MRRSPALRSSLSGGGDGGTLAESRGRLQALGRGGGAAACWVLESFLEEAQSDIHPKASGPQM